jgi:hypothetical protein
VLIRPPSRLQQMMNMIEILFTQIMALRMSLRTDRGEQLIQGRMAHPCVWRWESVFVFTR